MNKILIFLLPIFVTVSCVVQRTVYYDTKDVLTNLDKPEFKRSICILPFNDIRKDVIGNEIYFKKTREIFDGNKTYCINSEYHYKNNPLGEQMAWMLADHITKRGTFKKVTVNKKDSADYIIECNLARITGKQHLPESMRQKAVGSGVVTVMVFNIKTKALVSFAITDVKVYDRNMKLIAELGSFAKDYEDELPPDRQCWCSYNNVSDKLKDFYTGFVIELENRIAELK